VTYPVNYPGPMALPVYSLTSLQQPSFLAFSTVLYNLIQ